MSDAKKAAKPASTTSLAFALLHAQSSIDGVGKDARNSFHKYSYTSAEGMISACREALHGAGLTLQRSGWRLHEDGQTVTSTFILRHAASGEQESYEVPWLVVVEKGRPIDKALAGALTTSLGYLLRDLLLLPREDEDGSMDRRNDDPKRPAADVGFRPAPKPAPRATAVDDLNAKLVPPAEADRDVTRTGVVKRVNTRKHGGREYLIAEFEDSGDGTAVSITVPPNLEERLIGAVGEPCSVTFTVRAGKSSVMQAIEVIRDGGDDVEELPF